MLFGKRDKIISELNEKANVIQNELRYLREEIKNILPVPEPKAPPDAQLLELAKGISKLGKQIKVQSLSFEDLLDEFQRLGTAQDEAAKVHKENEKKEIALLYWAVLEREQFRMLKAALLKNSDMSEEARQAWSKQLGMMEAESANAMVKCGVQEFGAQYEPFDTELHEVIKVLETDEKALEGTIAEVYKEGMFYCGKLLQKAKTAVYRWRDSENINSEETEDVQE